ncbi:MAG: DUF480 domain-containing protein [Burkholderiales bacterium]|nr:DUF480 domain-containing protein [Opitutaceae bacterium]
MDTSAPALAAAPFDPPLTALEARVLGCLIEKEFATPDLYPLTHNALINACNQRSNRAPVMAIESPALEVAIEGLRRHRVVAHFTGAEARAAKFKQTLDLVHPVEPEVRALLAELLLRGPQTTAGLRGNAERMLPLPEVMELETRLAELAGGPMPLVRKLPRQSGQKEARWAQLFTGEPAADEGAAAAEPMTVTVRTALPPEAEQRLAMLEAEVARLGAELLRLRAALGE